MWYDIEKAIIIIVVIVQVVHSTLVLKNIFLLKNIFNKLIIVKNGFIERRFLSNPESVIDHIIYLNENVANKDISDKNTVKISTTDTDGDNQIIIRIKNAINIYLVNNYGAAVNFSIIKDIIDREVDAKDEDISQAIPTPLYLGLAATMVGIIFGLLAMPSMGAATFSEGINALIDGVKLAMGASLAGLVCTTTLSSLFYKKAKKKSLTEKNQQLSYLQAKLLPELLKAEDTGVSGLKASLDRFAREATIIADKVNYSTFQSAKNIEAERDILAKLDRMNIVKVQRINLDLFDRLDNNMEAFNKFSEFLSVMADISENLKNFAGRTNNIDGIAGQIKSTLDESKALTKFLAAHFEKLEQAGSSALNAVNLSDSHFRESIEKLRTGTDEIIIRFSASANQRESDLREYLEKINIGLKETIANHIDEFKSAYSNAVPQFQHLDKLESLVPIKETIDSKSSEFIEHSKNSDREVISKLTDIGNRLNGKNGNHESLEGLENAIKELTRQLTGRETILHTKWRWLKKFESVLRIIAWGCIISVSVGLALIYFKIL